MAELVLPTTKDALKEELQHWKAKYEGAATRARNWADQNSEMLETVANYGGAVVTGPVSAAGTGFLETRFPNKDGTMLSLGPIPLPLVVGATALTGSLFVKNRIAKGQALAVVASNVGLWAGTVGRGYGAAALAKKKKEKKSGTEGTEIGATANAALPNGSDWSAEEKALLGL